MIAGMLNAVGAGMTAIFFLGLYFRGIGPRTIEEFISRIPAALQILILLLLVQLGLEHYSLAPFVLPGSNIMHILLWFSGYMMHEGGHVYFAVFGEPLNIIGGTLTETLIPGGIFAYCLWKGYFRLGGACLFFAGYLLHGVAAYAATAPAMKQAEIPMYGIHDWKYLFDRFALMPRAGTIAQAIEYSGIAICAVGCLLFALGIFLSTRSTVSADPDASEPLRDFAPPK